MGLFEFYGGLMLCLLWDVDVMIVGVWYWLLLMVLFFVVYDDVFVVYFDLIDCGYCFENIVMGGDSVGGGLMFVLLVELCCCDLCFVGVFVLLLWMDLILLGLFVVVNVVNDFLLLVDWMYEVVMVYVGDMFVDDLCILLLFVDFDVLLLILF